MGKDVKHIPGGRYGETFKYAGNISHTSDVHRARSFPRFSEAELVLQDEEKVIVSKLPEDNQGLLFGRPVRWDTNVVTLHDDTSEKTVEFETNGGTVRVSHFRGDGGGTRSPEPEVVYRTPESSLQRGASEAFVANLAIDVFPRFKFGVLGISSEVARFLMKHLARDEYEICIEAFSALPTHNENGHIAPQLGDAGRLRGGDLCFPQLSLKVGYKPGGCVVFRGAELEHFVEDWHGSRMFALCTNHPANRPRRPDGPEAEGGINAAADAEADDDAGLSSGEYGPCVTEEIDVEKPPEGGWTDADIHGAGTWDPAKNAYPMEQPTDESSTRSSLSRVSESDTIAFSDSKRQRLE
ncbi:hypothetical protein DL767_008851 [Monosporascus sp. MG133]|nr:hypothetical protein DL767_008851 [Monosporascus sp. MG133]